MSLNMSSDDLLPPYVRQSKKALRAAGCLCPLGSDYGSPSATVHADCPVPGHAQVADPHLENLPHPHPRSDIVAAADLDFSVMMIDLRRNFHLTPSEVFMILAGQMNMIAGSCVRLEREK